MLLLLLLLLFIIIIIIVPVFILILEGCILVLVVHPLLRSLKSPALPKNTLTLQRSYYFSLSQM